MEMASHTLSSPHCLTRMSVCTTATRPTSSSSGFYRRRTVRLSSSFLGSKTVLESDTKCKLAREVGRSVWNASKFSGASFSQFGKDAERIAAKEALLLAIADAGAVEAPTARKEDTADRIAVTEKLLSLERLNPTPRPTTSPLLEGLWHFKWSGAWIPSVFGAQLLARGIPPSLASISSLNVLILDGIAKATTGLKFLNTIESSFTLSIKLSPEGPTTLKEAFVEGAFSPPSVTNGRVPSQLKDLYDQLVASIERLPNPVKDFLTTGMKVPIRGKNERQLLISYLDDEVLIARDESGVPGVLYRIEQTTPINEPEPVSAPEYVS